MPHLEGRRKVHRRHLAPDGFHDLRPAVTGVHAPQAGTPVEDLAAFGGPVIHALGTGKQARGLLELPVGCIRHPEADCSSPATNSARLFMALSLLQASLAASAECLRPRPPPSDFVRPALVSAVS